MNKFLELNNISKTFETSKKLKVIKNLSYNFKKGKIYSLMGPSGSGKSTLLNLISLIDKPSNGLIKFNKHQINYDKKEQNDQLRAKKSELFISKIIYYLTLHHWKIFTWQVYQLVTIKIWQFLRPNNCYRK